MEQKYKLHSKAKDNTWFHFRENLNSLCESFTISYLSDGTCVMSGDYGTLTWQRNSFAEAQKGNYDYGFPGEDTGISYFAEKVCQYGIKQIIKGFDIEQAWKELEEYCIDNEIFSKNKIQEFKNYSDWCSDMSEEEFIKFLRDDLDLSDSWELNLGVGYNSAFSYRFNMLKSVSQTILDEVKKSGN